MTKTIKMQLDRALNSILKLRNGRRVWMDQGLSGRGELVWIISLTKPDGRIDYNDHRFSDPEEAANWWAQYEEGAFG
jgi:hypothetical protein